MAAGAPPIATSVGGPAEIIDDDISRLLRPPRQLDAREGAIRELMRDPDRWWAMGTRGIETAKCFSVDKIADRLIDLYRSVDPCPQDGA